jgi:hypothetical protein
VHRRRPGHRDPVGASGLTGGPTLLVKIVVKGAVPW